MELNKYIDHTNLKATSTMKDIEKLCNEAIEYGFASVCVNPYYVNLASKLLKDSNIGVCTVVGFPLGMNTISVKEYEAIDAINNGATEIDMVINIGALKNKDYEYIKEEIESVRDAIDGNILKVIIETCYLTDDEIKKMTEICNETFVNFIKTSTGFGTRGASVNDVEIMNKYKNEVLEIKASGGIKTIEFAEELINAGATRLGTSSGVELMQNECDCEDCHCHEDGCHCHEHECHSCNCEGDE